MKPKMATLVLALAVSAGHVSAASLPPAARPLLGSAHAARAHASAALRAAPSPAIACTPDATHLCLNRSRFRVETSWVTASGTSGSGTAVRLTDDTGYFWFFDSTNVEVILKVLDGCGVNGRFWVFTAGLTNVAVQLTVTDVVTGAVKQYQNAQNSAYRPIQDTSAFSGCDGARHVASESPAAPASASRHPSGTLRSSSHLSATATPSACTPGEGALCLNGDRFQVSATWTTADGATGAGHAVALTPDTGYFWFFSSSNVELVVKVLDGCALSRQYWVFAAGLTDVAVTIQVTDTVTGKVRSYTNPQHSTFEPVQDTAALAACLPSCDSKALTVQQVKDTVSASLAGLADPFGADLHLALNRFMAAEGCDLASQAGSTQSAAVSALSPKGSFDPTVQYCGPLNSNDHAWLRLLLVSPGLNEACYRHDNCYDGQCNAPACYFVPGLTTSCDQPLLTTCDNDIFALQPFCPIVADCYVCAIAEAIYSTPRSLRPAECQRGPCNDDQGLCDPSSGLCGGRVIDSLARDLYNYPLIDSLLPGQFPRGGSYGVQLTGEGLGGATKLTTDNLAVSGSVLSSSPSAVALQLTSTPVPECQTSSAAILVVSLSLLGDWPGGISAPTAYVVAGPSPQVERFLVTDGPTSLPRGSPVQMSFTADILSAGNVQFFYVGCAVCQVEWGPSTGDQFQTTLSFTVTVTIPSDWGASTWLVEVGAVDGAGQGGILCPAGSGSPATMLIEVSGSPPGSGPGAAGASLPVMRWTLSPLAPGPRLLIGSSRTLGCWGSRRLRGGRGAPLR